MKTRVPYALLLLGTIGIGFYPRLLGAGAPAMFRTDGFVGFVHGISLGLEILAVMMVANRTRCARTAQS